MHAHCPFCEVHPSRVILASSLAFAIRDAFPVSRGHTLIVPRRHIGSFFDACHEERVEMLNLLDTAKVALDDEFQPNGYNVGINDGLAAGQTILHLHVHLIPRFSGDRKDPRGGVRWIFPDKADYWTKR